MIWRLRGYGPDGVFVSETVDGRYAECWPQAELRGGWGHKQTFDGYELYPYYAYVGRFGQLIRLYRGGYVAFGSLEECMTTTEWVLTGDVADDRTYRERDRRFTP